MRTIFRFIIPGLAMLILTGSGKRAGQPNVGPVSMAYSSDDHYLYVAGKHGKCLQVLDTWRNRLVRSVPMEADPVCVFISGDDRLMLLLGEEKGRLLVLERESLERISDIPVGHSPVSIAESKDHFILCHRYTGEVSFISKDGLRKSGSVKVGREPVAMVLCPDREKLYVAHLLPEMSSTEKTVAAKVSVVDIQEKRLISSILLPNGSTGVRGIAASPDGAFVFVTHVLARFNLPTTQLERGWMNTNAMTIIDTEQQKVWKTVLLDDVDYGAANPWGIACSPDGEMIYVTHAGTHEVSILNWGKMREELISEEKSVPDYSTSENLGFVYPFRRRIRIPGNGPRTLLLSPGGPGGSKLFTANYFSDNIGVVNTDSTGEGAGRYGMYSIELSGSSLSTSSMSMERRGEMFFNDASLCFQNWQSCASCHPDSRSDGLNWDLLNDGISNPKNTKSLLFSHETPPVMSLGVRSHAKVAVRAGFRYIQFTDVPEEYSLAVDAYLQSLEPVASPYAGNSRESKAGEKLYYKLSCDECHSGPYYTDLQSYPTGLDTTLKWDTPVLNEVWRTEPYWHDGRHATLEALFEQERHGLHEPLTTEEAGQLVSYLKTL